MNSKQREIRERPIIFSTPMVQAEGVSKDLLSQVWSAKDEFRGIWQSLNAKPGRSWDDNPFVWVIEFLILRYIR